MALVAAALAALAVCGSAAAATPDCASTTSRRLARRPHGPCLSGRLLPRGACKPAGRSPHLLERRERHHAGNAGPRQDRGSDEGRRSAEDRRCAEDRRRPPWRVSLRHPGRDGRPGPRCRVVARLRALGKTRRITSPAHGSDRRSPPARSVRGTMFPSRAPFFRDRLKPRAAEIAAWAEERERGNLAVSPYAPSTAHRPRLGR